VIATLALGIAINTIVFSAVNAFLWRPLPVTDAGSLVRIGESVESGMVRPLSWLEYGSLREGVPALSGVVAARANQTILRVREAAREALLEAVSANYFSVLGVAPLVGRGFRLGEDEVAGGAAVIVISERLWRTELDGDPNAVGQAVRINGHPFEIVGVMPASFTGTFTGFRVDVWVPVSMLAIALPLDGSLDRIEDRFLTVIGRYADGATEPQLRDQVETRISSVRMEAGLEEREMRVHLASAAGLLPVLASAIRGFLLLLLALVSTVLLIACANAANLMFARSLQRRGEMWLRTALGASRWALVLPILLEGILLACGAGMVAWMLSWWAVGALRSAPLDVGLPLAPDIALDVHVFVYMLALITAAALAFSVLPAILSTRERTFTPSHLRTVSGPRSRLRSGLVVIQVALSALLVTGAMLVVRGLGNARETDPGFQYANVLVASADPGQLGYDAERGRALWHEMLEATRRSVGVADASLALMVPLGGRSDHMRVAVTSDATGSGSFLDYEIVAPGWFSLLRIAILAGRDVTERDAEGTEQIALLSRSMALSFWPDALPGDVIGRAIRVTDRAGADRVVIVTGVVEDIAYRSATARAHPVLYLPFRQWYRPDMVMHVRTRGDAVSVIRSMRAIVQRLEPELPLAIETMENEMAVTLVPLRVASVVLGSAGAAGWVLATIGLFGLIAYATSQRVREIAIRLALGARPGVVLWSVVRDGLTLTLIGLALGLSGAVAAARALGSAVSGLPVPDVASLSVLAGVFLAVSAAASAGPARRASVVDPVRVLRHD
jgi:predicted permease